MTTTHADCFQNTVKNVLAKASQARFFISL